MSLRLIYGKSGCGKSEYCFKEIAKNVNKEKIYMIVPNQMALMAEKRLMEKADNLALVNTEVITFSRMAFRVRNEIGGAKKTNLSKSGKAMLLYDILSKCKDNLNFLGKNAENVDIIGNSITEFKKHRINIDNLKEEANTTTDMYLKLKLNDMITMYEEFEKSIQDKFLDENDVLDILNTQILESNQFKNTTIYIDEFVGFTTQEYEIIAKLMQLAKEVNVTICTDNLLQQEDADKDIFYANKKYAKVNGKKMTLKAAPYFVTYKKSNIRDLLVPAKQAAAFLGLKYTYSSRAKLVTLGVRSGIETSATQVSKVAKTRFINKMGPLARANYKRTGILASVTMAQAILESGWGQSTLERK